MKNIILISLLLLVSSCNRQDINIFVLPEETPIKGSDYLNEMIMTLPLGIDIIDDKLLIFMHKDEHVIRIVDANTGAEINQTGIFGNGPGEFIQPVYCVFNKNKDIYIYNEGQKNLRKYTYISTYYEQKYLELKSIARYIRKRKKKGIFEYLFLEQTKAFWEQMERSIQILNETTPSRRGWCHGAYNHHNIIMTSSAPATIHFEHFYHGYPILDVYYFLKKALEKNNYNFAFCETFLSNYDRFMPLSKDDLLCLYGLFLFPEKFWKISNQYMAHKKHWISPRYIEKLEEFIHNKEARSIFLEKYVQIYNVFS